MDSEMAGMGDVTVETYENKQAALVDGAQDHAALNVTDNEEVFRMVKENEFCMLDEEIPFLPFWENGVRFLRLWDRARRKSNSASIYSRRGGL